MPGNRPCIRRCKHTENYKRMRRDLDPFYQEIYVKGRVTMKMRFLEKMDVFAKIEKEIDAIREKAPVMTAKRSQRQIRRTSGRKLPRHRCRTGHDRRAATRISAAGDSAAGIVEVVATGRASRAWRTGVRQARRRTRPHARYRRGQGVEVGAGIGGKKHDRVSGATTRCTPKTAKWSSIPTTRAASPAVSQPASRSSSVLAVKPTPTIAKRSMTIDKYTLENKRTCGHNPPRPDHRRAESGPSRKIIPL